MDSGESGCGVSESNACLMGLLPSKGTTSIFEKNLDKLGGGLEQVAKIAGEYNGTAANILKASAAVSNFIVSDEKGVKRILRMWKKKWFLYRFLDEERRCCAVEWNVSRNVVHQYGSALRGSILLAFHGNPTRDEPLKLLLRPRLNFGETLISRLRSRRKFWNREMNLNYDPPHKQLEQENPVQLSINPIAA
jgi:hypothetical protein